MRLRIDTGLHDTDWNRDNVTRVALIHGRRVMWMTYADELANHPGGRKVIAADVWILRKEIRKMPAIPPDEERMNHVT